MNKIGRLFASLALMTGFFIVACGGGSNAPVGGVTPNGTLRADLLYGYYYSTSMTVNETAGHANLHWASYAEDGVIDPARQMAGLIQARANGQKVVLMVPIENYPLAQRESEMRFWLDRLKNAGLIWDGIVAIYPMDEPELRGIQDADVTATNAAVRRAMSAHPELKDTKLAVFYACSSGLRPGIASYDWVGCDDYNSGCGVLKGHVAQLRAAMKEGQRLMVIPGGADPWRQEPWCFEAFAHTNSDVVALIAFLWQTEGRTVGIRDNGMRLAYCEAGSRIVRPSQQPNCRGA